MHTKRRVICNHILFCKNNGLGVGYSGCRHAKVHKESHGSRVKDVIKGEFIYTNPKMGCSNKGYHPKCYWTDSIEGRRCIKVGK